MKVNLGRHPIREKMTLFARPDADAEHGFILMPVHPTHEYWMRDSDIKVDTVNIEYLPPQNMSREEMIQKAVITLRDKQKQIRAEAHKEVQKLEEKINEMLLLTHQPEPESTVIDLEIVDTQNSDDIPF